MRLYECLLQWNNNMEQKHFGILQQLSQYPRLMDGEHLTEDNGKQFWNPNFGSEEFCASYGNRSLSNGNEQKH